MNHNVSRMIMYISMLVGIVPLCVGIAMDIQWLTVCAGCVVAGGFIQGCIFARCPHCGMSLIKRTIGQEYCPYCGEHLD